MEHRDGLKGEAGDAVTAAANTAVVKTYVAAAKKEHVIEQIIFSHSGDPIAGSLKIEDGVGTTIFDVDIIKGGPGPITFDPPIYGSINTAMVVTLAAGGAGIIGKLNIRHR